MHLCTIDSNIQKNKYPYGRPASTWVLLQEYRDNCNGGVLQPMQSKGTRQDQPSHENVFRLTACGVYLIVLRIPTVCFNKDGPEDCISLIDRCVPLLAIERALHNVVYNPTLFLFTLAWTIFGCCCFRPRSTFIEQ